MASRRVCSPAIFRAGRLACAGRFLRSLCLIVFACAYKNERRRHCSPVRRPRSAKRPGRFLGADSAAVIALLSAVIGRAFCLVSALFTAAFCPARRQTAVLIVADTGPVTDQARVVGTGDDRCETPLSVERGVICIRTRLKSAAQIRRKVICICKCRAVPMQIRGCFITNSLMIARFRAPRPCKCSPFVYQSRRNRFNA